MGDTASGSTAGFDYYENGVIKASPLHSMYSDYQDGFGLIPYISMMKTKGVCGESKCRSDY